MSEHFNECGSDFERVFSHLGSISNAYIAIFVAHHERSIHYLNVIEEKANKLFNSVQGSYLSDSDMRDFDKQSQLIIKATLPKSDNNPEEERDKVLIEKENIEAVRERECCTDEEEAESVADIRDFILDSRAHITRFHFGGSTPKAS